MNDDENPEHLTIDDLDLLCSLTAKDIDGYFQNEGESMARAEAGDRRFQVLYFVRFDQSWRDLICRDYPTPKDRRRAFERYLKAYDQSRRCESINNRLFGGEWWERSEALRDRDELHEKQRQSTVAGNRKGQKGAPRAFIEKAWKAFVGLDHEGQEALIREVGARTKEDVVSLLIAYGFSTLRKSETDRHTEFDEAIKGALEESKTLALGFDKHRAYFNHDKEGILFESLTKYIGPLAPSK